MYLIRNVFWLSLQLVSGTFLIPGRIPRDIITNTVFMDNAVGKENRYWLECSAFKPWRRHNFPRLSGTAPPPARWTTGFLHGVEWPRHSADHPPPSSAEFNHLSPELNSICYLLVLLAHHFLHVSRIRVKSLTLRWLMSYIYIWSTYSWCF